MKIKFIFVLFLFYSIHSLFAIDYPGYNTLSQTVYPDPGAQTLYGGDNVGYGPGNIGFTYFSRIS